MLDKDSPLPLYVLVKEYILKQIVSGKYPPNSKIPTEFELMEQLGVGRATVRSALAMLENEGRIVKRHGIGTFVVERNKTFVLEPFISLSFSLSKIGIKGNNKLIKKEDVTVKDGILKDRWDIGTQVEHIKRIRYADDFPIAIEDNYFVPELYELVKDAGESDSIAHQILANSDLNIGKIDNCIIIKNPTDEEAAVLSIKPETKIIELTRWLYFEGDETPSNFVRFIIAEDIFEFPFNTL